MKKKTKNIFICLLVMFSIWIPRHVTKAQYSDVSVIKEQVSKAIDSYFELRYLLFSEQNKSVNTDAFEKIINNKLISEKERLNIELDHAILYNLLYQDYKFILNFQSFEFSEDLTTVVVRVLESHEVVFTATAPIISKMWGKPHIIELKANEDTWEVISDDYNDYLWRLIEFSGLSSIEFSNSMHMNHSLQKDLIESDIPYGLQDSQTMGSYYSNGAVSYAHQWAYSRNPAYYNFGDYDCTNFVSQAMKVGGYIPMTTPLGGIGTAGWYYISATNRAAAWTWAPSLYSFIVNQENPVYFPGAGPKGYRVYGLSNVGVGDLIFYDFSDQPELQDHLVMVVSWSVSQPLVAGHSDNVDYYPYNAFNYIQQIFLIHITGF